MTGQCKRPFGRGATEFARPYREGLTSPARLRESIRCRAFFAGGFPLTRVRVKRHKSTTYQNLAVALESLGQHQQAESVLERGTSVYPYSGPLVARLAQQYFNDGQAWRARIVMQQYRKLFPEDPTVGAALKQFENPRGAANLSAVPSRGIPVWIPK